VRPLKQYSESQKIKFLGLVESPFPVLLLGEFDHHFLIFNDSTLLTAATLHCFEIKSEVSLLRNSSKDNLYHLEDISIHQRVVLFGNKKFVAVCSYVNGDLLIYSTNGKRVFKEKGGVKSLIYVNKKENLLLCGSKSGLLEVYEILYG
jgi:hypothetical protein